MVFVGNVIAISSYVQERPDELNIEVNDVITVLERTYPKWWSGVNQRTKITGMFRADLIRPIDQQSKYQNNGIISNVRYQTQQQQQPYIGNNGLNRTKPIQPRNFTEPQSRINGNRNNLEEKQTPENFYEIRSLLNRSGEQKILAQQSAALAVQRMQTANSSFTPLTRQWHSNTSLHLPSKPFIPIPIIESDDDSFENDDEDDNEAQDSVTSDSVSYDSSQYSSQLYSLRVMNVTDAVIKDQKNKTAQQRSYVLNELSKTELEYLGQLSFTIEVSAKL